MIPGDQLLHQPGSHEPLALVVALSLREQASTLGLPLQSPNQVLQPQVPLASGRVFEERFQDQAAAQDLPVGAFQIRGEKGCVLPAIGEGQKLASPSGQIRHLFLARGGQGLVQRSGQHTDRGILAGQEAIDDAGVAARSTRDAAS